MPGEPFGPEAFRPMVTASDKGDSKLLCLSLSPLLGFARQVKVQSLFGRFDDLDQLTMFADNLVPHVLRIEGVLEFTPALIDRIEAVEDITIGSPEEIEIRACAVHAVELLTAAVRTRAVDPRPQITTGSLDNVLWNTGSEARYKAVPRHRSRCVFY